tara:strand:+ start:430 stop:726 length:297 start_codon:yes stop_codon:yes gene_type:complete
MEYNCFIIENFNNIIENYNTKNYNTLPILSIYEKTKILGLRLSQLEKGSLSYLKDFKDFTIKEIALKELEKKLLPYIILRKLPNEIIEYWKLEDLIII